MGVEPEAPPRKPSGKASGAVRALVRLSPLGDAARSWGALLPALIAAYALAQGASLFWIVFVDVYYVVYLILTWTAMWRSSPEEVREWAMAQKSPHSKRRRLLQILAGSRVFSGKVGLLIIGSFSFVGLVLGLVLLSQARLDPAGGGTSYYALYALGVVASWALLHTGFALYYAHLYYNSAESPSGLRFPGDEDPDPLDFAYYAFAIGTTFAVSDVEATSRKMRRPTLAHCILSFFYNTAILAMVLNLVLGSS